MKKGFTLIELLAVIIVLAIISLIATPALINVIEEAKDKSDLESVHGILDSARLYYSESMMNSDSRNDIENLNNIYEKVSLSVKEKTGELYINDKGLSAVAIVIRNKCYTKKFSGELKISSNINNCTLGFVGKDETSPTVIFSVEDGVFNSNNWAKNNFNVNITINDNESGPSSYKYCIDTNICEPIALVNKSTGFSEINSESLTNKVCVIGIDNYGNESDIICSDDYKLDKTNPTIIVDNISINKNNVIDLNSDITTNDTLSGVDNITYDPTNIDSSIAGDKKVTYTVTDKAGNSTSIERTITVITDKPTVSFTTLTNSNGNGWFNSDFYIKAQASVDNITSVRSIKWCSSTSECVPTTALESDNVTGYISTNSISNKMCVQITDQTGNESDVICSNNYKLDSVRPNLTAKAENIAIMEGNNYQVSSYFNTPSYGISGGSLSCNPTNTSELSVGTKTVFCTATSNSGLSTMTNKIITVNKSGNYYFAAYSYRADSNINNGGTYLIIKGKYNGSSWSETTVAKISEQTMMDNFSIADISISAVDENTVFVGRSYRAGSNTNYGGTYQILKYEYNGSGWNETIVAALSDQTMMSSFSMAAISISAVNKTTVFVGRSYRAGSNTNYGGTYQVLKYQYNGSSWNEAIVTTISEQTIMSNFSMADISVSTVDENTVFVGRSYRASSNTNYGGTYQVLKYQYNGSNWSETTVATISEQTIMSNFSMTAISISAVDQTTVFVGRSYRSGSNINNGGTYQVSKYKNNGSNWSETTVATISEQTIMSSFSMTDIGISAANENAVFVGRSYRSGGNINNGGTYQVLKYNYINSLWTGASIYSNSLTMNMSAFSLDAIDVSS